MITDFSTSGMANGDIHPARAVMIDTSVSHRVIEATAGAFCVGIAQLGERRDPSNSDGLAAKQGEPIKYWGHGAKDVPAQLGASCTAGDRLKATTAGKLIPVAADGDKWIAIAKQSGANNDLIAVDVVIGQAAA